MSKQKAAGPADTPPAGGHNAVTLGPRDKLIGRLHIEGDLHVNGTVEGEVDATGDIDIEDEAKVNASVAGRQVSIRGSVSGPVTASKKLVVGRSGSLFGDVRVPSLVVQEGATFNGNVSMTSMVEPASKPPEAAAKPPEITAQPPVVAAKAPDVAAKPKPKR